MAVRVRATLMPTVSAARGCSPHARRRETPARSEQEERQRDDGRVHEVDEDRLIEQDRPDDRNLDQARDRDVGQRVAVGVQDILSVLHDRPVQEGRQAQRQNVQHDADDNLIHPVLDGKERQ